MNLEKEINSIYYYCSIEDLKNILENKVIKLSDIRKSKDSKEIDFLFQEYNEYLYNQIKDSKYVKNDVLNYIKREIKLKNRLEEMLFLILSLSKNYDDIHMWNCYGDKGVCIEFDMFELEKYLKSLKEDSDKIKKESNIPYNQSDLYINEVKYRNKKTLNQEFIINSNKKTKIQMDNTIFLLCPIFKNSFFQCENEVRIVYRERLNNLKNAKKSLTNYFPYKNSDNDIKECKFETISDDFYPHKIILNLPIDIKLIKSITIRNGGLHLYGT